MALGSTPSRKKENIKEGRERKRREGKEGRKEGGRKEGRKEGREGGRKEGRKELYVGWYEVHTLPNKKSELSLSA
jgi:flagellar biosynthesis/type III secretory pathway protein FliH